MQCFRGTSSRRGATAGRPASVFASASRERNHRFWLMGTLYVHAKGRLGLRSPALQRRDSLMVDRHDIAWLVVAMSSLKHGAAAKAGEMPQVHYAGWRLPYDSRYSQVLLKLCWPVTCMCQVTADAKPCGCSTSCQMCLQRCVRRNSAEGRQKGWGGCVTHNSIYLASSVGPDTHTYIHYGLPDTEITRVPICRTDSDHSDAITYSQCRLFLK